MRDLVTTTETASRALTESRRRKQGEEREGGRKQAHQVPRHSLFVPFFSQTVDWVITGRVPDMDP